MWVRQQEDKWDGGKKYRCQTDTFKFSFLQNNGIDTNAEQDSFASEEAMYMLILGFTVYKDATLG